MILPRYSHLLAGLLPDARLKKGLAYEKLGRKREAIAEFRVVVDRYPNSEAGKKARERLTP